MFLFFLLKYVYVCTQRRADPCLSLTKVYLGDIRFQIITKDTLNNYIYNIVVTYLYKLFKAIYTLLKKVLISAWHQKY